MKTEKKAIIAVVGVLAVLTIWSVALLISKVPEARREANRAVSMTNIRAIDQACVLYAQTYEGEYPPSLEAMMKEGLLSAKTLVNPDRPEYKVGYVYLRPSAGMDSPPGLLVYEKFEEWDGGIMTSFGLITDEELFKKVLAESQQEAGLSEETLRELSKPRYGRTVVSSR